jgi:Mrp family chromosome partitioning ATPase/capsular polysaccharide biosynthesis protein
MTETGHHESALTLRDYLTVITRRKWVILAAIVLVPATAIGFSLHQTKLYQAHAQVLLSTNNLTSQLAGTQQQSGNQNSQVDVQTQADLARVPAIFRRVLTEVPAPGLSAGGLMSASGVSVAENATILVFSVTNASPKLAARLVDAYASAYTDYRRQLDTAAIKKALAKATARIGELAKAHQRRSSLYAALVEREQTLQTMEALQTSNASVVQKANNAVQVQPRTSRNAILGLLLGVVLGLALALLREALDTRVRNAQEIGERLGRVPLLARVPAPPKRLADRGHLLMVDEPYGPNAEAFRMLRTNLDFVSLDREARTVMITSAVAQEGKSTTIANLAVALARAGKRVALVDLDLRRPILHKFFGLEGPGVTQVALGHAKLEDALVTIALSEPSYATEGNGNGKAKQSGKGNGNGNGRHKMQGILEVLPSGAIPPDPGEFVGTAALADILRQLRERADIVLIDSPPVLHVGDALTLSTRVDGIVLATRMKVVRRNLLHELARQVSSVPTPVLGFVVTEAGEEKGYGYGYGNRYGYGYGYEPRTFKSGEKAQAGSKA